MNGRHIDVAVIGCGMAGLTAGIYAARSGMHPVLFEQFLPGGQASNIRHLENYPGFAEGIDGATLIAAVQAQAEKSGCELLYENIIRIVPGTPHKIFASGQTYQADAIILACGSMPRKLGLPRENELTGRGVSYCATCDGALFRNKTVTVYGRGSIVLSDALELAGYASKVHLVCRLDEFSDAPQLQQRVNEADNITVHMSTIITELYGEDHLSAVLLKNRHSGLTRELPTDGLFVAIGFSPLSEFVKDVVELGADNGIVTDERMQTNIPGIFAAGDCRETVLRQVVTAAADGAIAGISAANYVRGQQPSNE